MNIDHQLLEVMIRIGWLTLAGLCTIIAVLFVQGESYEEDDEA